MDSGKAYHVVVAGAGPAGSVLAARLARGGLSVLLVEASDFHRARPGEFLTPQTRSMVNSAALLPDGWEQGHQAILEFVSTWGGSEPVDRSYIFDPHGHGLALDRARFDRDLAQAAEAEGASLLTRAHVRNVLGLPGGWEIDVECNSRMNKIRCDFLAVCCGRAGSPFPGLPVTRHRVNQLVCLGLRVAGYQGDVRPTTEAHPNGWVYSAGLASGELVVNAFTGPGQTKAGSSASPLDLLLRELAACPLAAARVMTSAITSAADVVCFATDASSICTRPVAGPNWCLAGDSAQSLDPLSSGGIAQAVRHAIRVADLVLAAASPGHVDLGTYSQSLDGEYSRYMTDRRRVYQLEQRWQTPFWRSVG